MLCSFLLNESCTQPLSERTQQQGKCSNPGGAKIKDLTRPCMLKWRKTAWATFLFVTLIFAVFTWGLQYKLSLYDSPHSIVHEMPEAKLLSNQERIGYTLPEAAVSASVVPPSSHFLLSIFRAQLFPNLQQTRLWGSKPSGTAPISGIRAASLTPFFFRPPPLL